MEGPSGVIIAHPKARQSNNILLLSNASVEVLTLWRDWLTPDVVNSLQLTDRQRQAIALVKAQGRITNRDHRNHTGVVIRTASRDLEELVKKGVLKKIGTTGRSTFDVLANKLDIKRTNRT